MLTRIKQNKNRLKTMGCKEGECDECSGAATALMKAYLLVPKDISRALAKRRIKNHSHKTFPLFLTRDEAERSSRYLSGEVLSVCVPEGSIQGWRGGLIVAADAPFKLSRSSL